MSFCFGRVCVVYLCSFFHKGSVRAWHPLLHPTTRGTASPKTLTHSGVLQRAGPGAPGMFIYFLILADGAVGSNHGKSGLVVSLAWRSLVVYLGVV